MKAAVVVAFALAVAGCGSKSAPAPHAIDCLDYALPAGWKQVPSKTGAEIVLAGATEYPVGTVSMHDTFTIRFIVAGLSLDDLKQQVLAATPAVINGLADEASREHPDVPTLAVAHGAPPTIVPVTISGYPGFRVDLRNTLTVGGAPIDRVNVTMFVKLGGEFVDVAAGYLASREAEDKPLSDAFLASINFKRCAAKP